MSKNKKQFVKIQINTNVIKDKKLMIATPMYGGNCTAAYLISLVNLFGLANTIPFSLRIELIYNDALVTRARNELVHTFLKSDYDYFMFIDGDIQFNARDILYMLQTLVESKDKEIIVGTYPKKQINWNNIDAAHKNNLIKTLEDYEKYSGNYVLNFNNANNSTQIKFNLSEPVKILDAGTGFMMIKRSVFDKFANAYPEQTYTDHDTKEKKIAYFDCKIDPDDNAYLSEDYMFTRWLKRIGIETWLFPWIKLAHQGAYIFNGDYTSYASLIHETQIKVGE
jgi:hypothetical protein